MAAAKGLDAQMDIADANVPQKTTKKRYYQRSGCRIQLRGKHRQRWHEIVNKWRSKNKLSIHANNKSYDFSLLRAMKANGYRPQVFNKLVQNYKSRFGQDGFLNLLKNCGLHKNQDSNASKHQLVRLLGENAKGVVVVRKESSEKAKKVESSEKEKKVQQITQITEDLAKSLTKRLFKKLKSCVTRRQITERSLRKWLVQVLSSPSSHYPHFRVNHLPHLSHLPYTICILSSYHPHDILIPSSYHPHYPHTILILSTSRSHTPSSPSSLDILVHLSHLPHLPHLPHW